VISRLLSEDALRGMQDGLLRRLSENSWIETFVYVHRRQDLAAVRVEARVSDMVPRHREFVADVDESWLVRAPRPALEEVQQFARFVETEREVRRWSAIDP
jgi:hypothetical protein